MKLLMLLPSSMLGGAERIAFSLAETMLRHGHEVTVCTISRGAGEIWPRLERHARFTLIASAAHDEKRGLLQFFRALPAIRARGRFDLVYTSHVHTNALASLLMRCGIVRARFLVSRESTRIFERFGGFRRAVYRACYWLYGRQDLLIFQTDEMQRSLQEHVRLPRTMAQIVLPNPVNLAQIDTTRGEDVGQNDSRAFTIVTCGRLIALKRVGLLLDALGQLAANRNWELHVLGDGELRQELEQQARNLGVGRRVIFHGNVANPYAFMARADLGVLCSEIEGFPNVLLEMMASGTQHIIATPCTPAVRKLPHVTILEEAHKDALVTKIAQAMDKPKDYSVRYRRHVEKGHSIETFANTVLRKLDQAQCL